MKRITLIIPLIIIIQTAFFLPAQAQLLDKLKKAAKDRLEDKAVEEVEEGVDKSVEKTEQVLWKTITGGNKKSKNKKKESRDKPGEPEKNDPQTGEEEFEAAELQEKVMSMMGGDAGKIETADSYSFTTEVIYEMVSYDKGKLTSMEYAILLNPGKEYMATKMGAMTQDGKKTKMPMDMTTIMDFQNNAMIMIMEQQKMANIMSMDELSDMAENEETMEEATITKTGQTKKILGYRCEEYKMTSADMEGNIWIAPKVEAYDQSFLKHLGNSAFTNKTELMELKGLMMEMEITVKPDKKNKSTDMKMNIISFEEKEKEIVMSNYKSLNMGSGFMNQRE